MRTAVVFLCKEPKQSTIDFAQEIKQKTGFRIFIVSDMLARKDRFYISDSFCKDFNYKGCNITGKETHIKKEIITWDKFLYLFCEVLTAYDFVWVFEDDVFIPSVEVLQNLHNKYNGYDLVTPNNFKKTDNAKDWHWKYIFDKIPPPYYYSMVCGMGLSRNLLNVIKQYVDENKQLFHIEAMFNTLANYAKLKIIDALELKSIVASGKWDIDDFLLLPNNVFHPRKDIENHPKLREQITDYQLSGYEPVDTLPDFVKK
jgi:hypothetical protein